MRLPITAQKTILLPLCPYCGVALIQPQDSVDPESMVFHIVRICQHMVECHQGLHMGKE